jgi:UDP-N-acetyl-2-amino-2-deoxyglucuronate dehydrogenase
MDKPAKIAIVGLGAVARKHIAAVLQFSDNLQLVAVVDSQADRVTKISKDLCINGFDTLEEMLEKVDVDIIVLCTPSWLHAQQAIRCINYAKHVVVEKPMALSWHDGLAMQKAIKNSGMHLWVVHQHRANPALKLLKRTIGEQGFGQIFQVNINVFWTRPQAYYEAAAWRGSRLMDGGALMNQASHTVDLLHWLFGPVQMVQAMWATQARQIETEDSCVLNIRWRQGALGSLNLSTLVYPKSLETSFTVIGEKGTAKLTGLASNEIDHWEFADLKVDKEELRRINQQAAQFIEKSHYYYYTGLIEELENKGTALPDVTEGLKTLEILTAAQQAATEHVTVSLPLAAGYQCNFSNTVSIEKA